MRKDNVTLEEKLKRLQVLSGIKPINENRSGSLSTIYDTVKINDLTYGIVKEGGLYFIKTTNSETINESTLKYIGGEANIKEYRYNSYADALKNLNMIRINECSNNMKPMDEDTDMDDSSDAGQAMSVDGVSEQLEKDIMGNNPQQDVVSQQPPVQNTQAPVSLPEPQAEPAQVQPQNQPAPEAAPDSALGINSDNDEDQIDHFVGKLTSELRKEGEDELNGDRLKGILNSILSAMPLERIDTDTRLEIAKRIKDGKDKQENGDDSKDQSTSDVPQQQPSPEPLPNDDEQQFNEEKYPWNKCEKDQEEKYGSKETADKICGAIKAKYDESFNPMDDQKINEFFHNNRKNVIIENSILKVKNILVETEDNKIILKKGDKSYTYNVSEKTITKLNQLKEYKAAKLMNEEIANYLKNKL